MAVYRRDYPRPGEPKPEKHKTWRYRRWVTLPSGKRVRVCGTPSINTKKAAEKAERWHIERTLNEWLERELPDSESFHARLELGRRLCEARKAWPARGPNAKGWGEFLAAEGIAERTARDYMALATSVGSSTQPVTYREAGIDRRPRVPTIRTYLIDFGEEWGNRWGWDVTVCIHDQTITKVGNTFFECCSSEGRARRVARNAGNVLLGLPTDWGKRRTANKTEPQIKQLGAKLAAVCDEERLSDLLDTYLDKMRRDYPALKFNRKSAARSLIMKGLRAEQQSGETGQ